MSPCLTLADMNVKTLSYSGTRPGILDDVGKSIMMFYCVFKPGNTRIIRDLLLTLTIHITILLRLSRRRQREVIAAAYEYNSLEWVFYKVKHIRLNINMSEPGKAAMRTTPFALNAFTCIMKF